jgi:hypothetical protein
VVDGSMPSVRQTRFVTTRVDGTTLVDLVEVRHCEAGEQLAAFLVVDRRAIGVVEEAFGEIRGWRQVLVALLVLDSDRIATEAVGQQVSSDVHLDLLEHLSLGQLGRLVLTEPELHPALEKPAVGILRVRVGNLAHRRVEGRLAQPLLVDPDRVNQLVIDDRVVHPHAALIEDAEDRPLGAQLVRETAPNLVRVRREIAGLEVVHVARVVLDPARPDPLRDRVAGELPRKSVLQIVLYGTPAFVSDPLRSSIPTRPGQVPLQFAA